MKDTWSLQIINFFFFCVKIRSSFWRRPQMEFSWLATGKICTRFGIHMIVPYSGPSKVDALGPIWTSLLGSPAVCQQKFITIELVSQRVRSISIQSSAAMDASRQILLSRGNAQLRPWQINGHTEILLCSSCWADLILRLPLFDWSQRMDIRWRVSTGYFLRASSFSSCGLRRVGCGWKEISSTGLASQGMFGRTSPLLWPSGGVSSVISPRTIWFRLWEGRRVTAEGPSLPNKSSRAWRFGEDSKGG